MEKKKLIILILKKNFLNFLKKKEYKRKSISNKIDKLNKFYLPLSQNGFIQYLQRISPQKVIGLSGGQGAGKSTITGILNLY